MGWEGGGGRGIVMEVMVLVKVVALEGKVLEVELVELLIVVMVEEVIVVVVKVMVAVVMEVMGVD